MTRSIVISTHGSSICIWKIKLADLVSLCFGHRVLCILVLKTSVLNIQGTENVLPVIITCRNCTKIGDIHVCILFLPQSTVCHKELKGFPFLVKKKLAGYDVSCVEFP